MAPLSLLTYSLSLLQSCLSATVRLVRGGSDKQGAWNEPLLATSNDGVGCLPFYGMHAALLVPLGCNPADYLSGPGLVNGTPSAQGHRQNATTLHTVQPLKTSSKMAIWSDCQMVLRDGMVCRLSAVERLITASAADACMSPTMGLSA
jgi:hypothetical protein